ncbi:MAG: hypothetical protein HYT49_02265 [Candidatus Wildermuthbacteria bacterium]|nr:hypothetical protein [Candidatus Wildermuthbacteria bacterium]
MRHFTFLIIFLSIVVPTFGLAQTDPVFQAPDTIEGAKEGVLNIGDKIIEAIPRAIAKTWNDEVIPLWRRMGEWIKAEVWEKRISPTLQTITDRVKELLGQEVEKRTPIIQQELEKEKEELQQELKGGAQGTATGLWERFRTLFHKD